MIDSTFGSIENHISIPNIFKTYVSESFFKNCLSCEKELLHSNSEYIIEKIYKDDVVEIEYAMCFECASKMRELISNESKQKIEHFFSSKINYTDRMIAMALASPTHESPWIENCLFTKTPLHSIKDYQLIAHCKGDQLLFSGMPYAVSGEIVEELNEILSPQTKEELDRFTDEHFNIPPEWKEILKSNNPILI